MYWNVPLLNGHVCTCILNVWSLTVVDAIACSLDSPLLQRFPDNCLDCSQILVIRKQRPGRAVASIDRERPSCWFDLTCSCLFGCRTATRDVSQWCRLNTWLILSGVLINNCIPRRSSLPRAVSRSGSPSIYIWQTRMIRHKHGSSELSSNCNQAEQHPD